MAGKSSGRTKAAGVGGQFRRLPEAVMWARIGQSVTGGTWLIRRDGDTYTVLSPAEQRRERQLQDA